MRTIYLAQRNSDLTEGRGPMETIAAFEQKSDAHKAASGWGVMGHGDGDIVAMNVFSSYDEFEIKNKKDLREQALSRLSREEIDALGITP